MQPTPQTEVSTVAPSPPTGKAVVSAPSRAAGRSSRLRPVLVGAALLLIGGLIGGLIVARRQQADADVLTINGNPITQEQFFHRLQIAAGAPVLRQMYAEEMQLQFAKQMGVLPTQAEVDAKYAEAQKQPNFAQNLKASRQTPEDVKHSLLVNLAQAAIYNKGITVSDADIHAFYDRNTDRRNPQARYYHPEAVQVAVIVTDKPADMDRALHELARGVSFADVARAYSKDQRSAANGGLLPVVQRGRVDPKKFPGLEAKLFGLKPGEQIDRVQIAGAYWIIRCLSHTPETTIPFEQVKDECREGAMLSKGLAANGKSMQDEYTAFQKEAEVKVLWPQYKDTLPVK